MSHFLFGSWRLTCMKENYSNFIHGVKEERILKSWVQFLQEHRGMYVSSAALVATTLKIRDWNLTLAILCYHVPESPRGLVKSQITGSTLKSFWFSSLCGEWKYVFLTSSQLCWLIMTLLVQAPHVKNHCFSINLDHRQWPAGEKLQNKSI